MGMANNRHRGSPLDSFLANEGILAETKAQAIEEVIEWRVHRGMRRNNELLG
jgi:antitoxin HicB